MVRSHFTGSRSSSPQITPLGGKFEKNDRVNNGPAAPRAAVKESCQSKAVDKPHSMTFSLSGKKMVGNDNIVPFQFGAGSPRGAANGGGASPRKKGSAPHSVASPGPMSPNPTGAPAPVAFGPVGTEFSPSKSKGRGGSPSVASVGIEFGGSPTSPNAHSSHGRRHPHSHQAPASGAETTGPEYSHACHANRSDFRQVDHGKRCSMERHTDPGYIVPKSTSDLRSSQRYCTSGKKSAESFEKEQPAHKSCVRVNNRSPSLQGVMMAAPMAAPKKTSSPAPWVHSGNSANAKDAVPVKTQGLRRIETRQSSPMAAIPGMSGGGGGEAKLTGRRTPRAAPTSIQGSETREIQTGKTGARTFHHRPRNASPIVSWN